MDIKSHEERSRNMARIKGTNTKPEIYIRYLLHKRGMRYRVNYSPIEGKPDLYFPQPQVAVFVHGCYWHRHKNCPYAYTPKSNVEFWTAKLEGNRKHDEQVISDLRGKGFRVLIVWECTIKRMQRDAELEKRVCNAIQHFIVQAKDIFLEI